MLHVPINELKPGMYVNQVLEQTGNMVVRSKGIVKDQRVIEHLASKGVLLVEVDIAKSLKDAIPKEASDVEEATPSPPPPEKKINANALQEADALYQKAIQLQSNFISLIKTGGGADAETVRELSSSIIDSVFDNRDAMRFLCMIKGANEYLLEHAINCSVLVASFADYLGYDRECVEDASLAALLMDSGMAELPPELYLHSSPLSPTDWGVIKTHVQLSVDNAEKWGYIPERVISLIAQHHERVDGSGYPLGLMGDDIEPLAKVIAIVDSFDAMISPQQHADAIPSSSALKQLLKKGDLDNDLVNQFINMMGIYPIGSLVRLKSGRLGIVCQRNPKDMLKPVIMSFYSITSGHYQEVKRVDLLNGNDEVESAVTPDSFNVDLPRFFRDVFIHQLPGK